MIQLVQGMQDIKLNNCERQKRWEWERIQVKLFKIGLKGLRIGQIQQSDSVFFHTDDSHTYLLHSCKIGCGGVDDSWNDDVTHIHHRAGVCTNR